MEPIGIAASLAQLIHFTLKTVKYLSSVKNAPKDRAGLLKEISSLVPLLVGLQDHVDEAKQPDTWFVGVRSLVVNNGPLDQLRQILEQLKDKLKPKKGIENTARNLIWTLDKPCCENMLQVIERAKSTINVALVAGAGKSILASVVVDVLRKHRMTVGSVGVAAVYCNFKDRQTQTPENLLAGACVQLANDLPRSLPAVLVDIYRSHSRLKTRPTLTEIIKILDDTVRDYDTVYMVIDALDKCSEQV
ncbi:MAG: hypothetical protein Q9221_002075 [Calogaya cf. arnoldii]